MDVMRKINAEPSSDDEQEDDVSIVYHSKYFKIPLFDINSGLMMIPMKTQQKRFDINMN